MLFAGDQSLATEIEAYWFPEPMDEVHSGSCQRSGSQDRSILIRWLIIVHDRKDRRGFRKT